VELISEDEFYNPEFLRIYKFFVLNTPCSKLSVQSKSLLEYGWSSPWKKPFWLNKQLKNASKNPDLLYSTDKLSLLEDVIKKADIKESSLDNECTEKVCFYNNQKNQFISVFYHLRNSLAHGRFEIKKLSDDRIFYFEDFTTKEKLSAKMILRKSTLLSWIQIIENGECKFLNN